MIAFFLGYNDGVGGMESHRDAFLKFILNKTEIIIITKYPSVTLLYNNQKIKYDNNTDLFLSLKKLSPSIIFFNDGHWVYEFSLIRSIFPQIQMIMRSGGNEFLKAPWHSVSTLSIRQKMWSEAINENLNFIIANSQYTKERMRNVGINSGKIIVIRGGVDYQRCMFLCKKRNLLRKIFDAKYGTKDKFLLVMVSRLVSFKGHCGFLNALKYYDLNDVNWYLVIVGDGPERENIDSLCKMYFKDDQYTLLGSIKHDFALYITAIADCFVCPSIEENRESGDDYYIHTETMGRSLLEAICLNAQIVASNAGAIPELYYENYQMIKLYDWRKPYDIIYHIKEIARNSMRKTSSTRFDIDTCKKYDWQYLFMRMYFPLFRISKKNDNKVCVCFDIDGTIVQPFCSEKENKENLLLFLNLAKRGYNVIINTAGAYEDVIVWQPIILKYINDIIIISNGGAKIFAYGRPISFWDNYVSIQRGITNKEIEFITKILTENRIIYKNVKKIDPLYVNIKIEGPINSLIEQKINKLILQFGFFVISNYNNLKILSLNVNKGTAFCFCKNAIISSKTDFGFGDNVLDTLFVRYCKYKYYINYKSNHIKNDCNYVTVNNSDEWSAFLRKTIKIIKGV